MKYGITPMISGQKIKLTNTIKNKLMNAIKLVSHQKQETNTTE
jgi:hypothetical protein